MLIGGIVAAVVLAALTIVLLTRRAAHDDLHSVEGYHRSIHTLESINAHPTAQAAADQSTSAVGLAFPESALRMGRIPSVRVTDTSTSPLPPVPPPPVLNPEVPVTFDDTATVDDTGPPPRAMPSHDVPGSRDKAMVSINHRPRRLAAPATAVAGVIVLVVVLLLTGSHKVAPPQLHHAATTANGTSSPGPKPQVSQATSTTTLPPPVSLPRSSTSSTATYDVAAPSFSLSFAATSGPCWVDATNSTSGATLFAGTLQPGTNHAVTVTGPVTVIIGAPTVLAVAVNGSPVAMPSGFETPFTMMFVTPS